LEGDNLAAPLTCRFSGYTDVPGKDGRAIKGSVHIGSIAILEIVDRYLLPVVEHARPLIEENDKPLPAEHIENQPVAHMVNIVNDTAKKGRLSLRLQG
jgi:hypothetical protein